MGVGCCEKTLAEKLQQQSESERIKGLRWEKAKIVKGRKVVGAWRQTEKSEEMNGEGMIEEEGKFYYEGQIKQGEPTGEGIMHRYGSEGWFQGKMKEGKLNGPGRWTDGTGKMSFNGEWREDSLNRGILFLNDKVYRIKKLPWHTAHQ